VNAACAKAFRRERGNGDSVRAFDLRAREWEVMHSKSPQSLDSAEFNENGAWSIGLNARSKNSLSDAEFLANVGKGLRAVYMDALRAPLPDNVRAALRRIDEVK